MGVRSVGADEVDHLRLEQTDPYRAIVLVLKFENASYRDHHFTVARQLPNPVSSMHLAIPILSIYISIQYNISAP